MSWFHLLSIFYRSTFSFMVCCRKWLSFDLKVVQFINIIKISQSLCIWLNGRKLKIEWSLVYTKAEFILKLDGMNWIDCGFQFIGLLNDFICLIECLQSFKFNQSTSKPRMNWINPHQSSIINKISSWRMG